MIEISFSTAAAAQVAIGALEQYGFVAIQEGIKVTTNSPALLVAPVIAKSIGLASVDSIDLARRRDESHRRPTGAHGW
jgi:hypothetical protein